MMQQATWRVIEGDCRDVLATLPEQSVQCVITSPPYFGLRSYGIGVENGEIGMEGTLADYIGSLVAVFRAVRRVLRDDGTVWLNLGDSFAGSWGNYGGKNRGQGMQRPVRVGSLPSPAWDGREDERPAATRPDRLGTGLKEKDLIGVPWRVAFALQEDGWWLRSDIIWAKKNGMPESVTDRPTRSHEYIFLLSKSARYFYDADAIAEPIADASILRLAQDVGNQAGSLRANGGAKTNGAMHAVAKKTGPGSHVNVDRVPVPRKKHTDSSMGGGGNGFVGHSGNRLADGRVLTTRNKRDVWHIATAPFKGAHFATFPPALIIPCVLAGCPAGGTILDPFCGAGTTGLVANRHDRSFVGIELNPEYAEMARRRIVGDAPLLNGETA